MNKISPCLLGLSLAVAGCMPSAAQETSSQPATHQKVLQITREFIKPGKSGAVHDKSESVFVQAMARAKWPTHYFALSSMSGKSRALYLTRYDSLEAWEKDNAAVGKNAVLSGALDRASVADGELLSELDQEVFYFEEGMSYHSQPDLSHARFMQINVLHVKPGHAADFKEMIKMLIEGNDKIGSAAHWGMYRLIYGAETGTYAMFRSAKSLAEVDAAIAENSKWEQAMGEEGLKKYRELLASTVDGGHREMFSINPKQSYPPEEWVKADPEFWKPKPAAAPAAKPAAEPAKAKP